MDEDEELPIEISLELVHQLRSYISIFESAEQQTKTRSFHLCKRKPLLTKFL